MTSREKAEFTTPNLIKNELNASSEATLNVQTDTEKHFGSTFQPSNAELNNQTHLYFKPTSNSINSSTRRTSDTCLTIEPELQYELQPCTKTALTKPSIPASNGGYDNEEHDLILYVNSVLGNKDGQRYLVLELLGKGTFGQVARCLNLRTRELVAVKVIKGKEAYYSQSLMEITILDLLNRHYDPQDRHHVIRLYDTFQHQTHLCLVFELLSISLYDLLKQNKFRGLSTNLIRVFTTQLLDSLCLLSEAHIIHADLKPENIMLKDLDSPEIKMIDFGSACHDQKTIFTYIQSRFYRSPEVIIGLPYTLSVDMWSLGCILAELFLGLPLFPGTSEYNQLNRIVELLGLPPVYMMELGRHGADFFNKTFDESGLKRYSLKTLEQYSQERNTQELPSKRYLPLMPIVELIRTYPIPSKLTKPSEIQKELNNRLKFADFILGLLALNPLERWSPQQARLHPFITGEPLEGHFLPPFIPRSSSLNNRGVSDLSPKNPSFSQSPSRIENNKVRLRSRASTVNSNAGWNVPAPIQQAAAVAGYSINNLKNTRRSKIQNEEQIKTRLSNPTAQNSFVAENYLESDSVSTLASSISDLNINSCSGQSGLKSQSFQANTRKKTQASSCSLRYSSKKSGVPLDHQPSSDLPKNCTPNAQSGLTCFNGSSKSRRTQSFNCHSNIPLNVSNHGFPSNSRNKSGGNVSTRVPHSFSTMNDLVAKNLPDKSYEAKSVPTTKSHTSFNHSTYTNNQAGLAPHKRP